MKQTIQIFDQNHRLTPMQKIKFCDYFKSHFSMSKQTSFLSRISAKIISKLVIFKQETINNLENFDWPTPLKNSIFWLFSNNIFPLPFCLKYQKSIIPSLFCPTIMYEKFLNFWPNSWTNPFAKNQIFPLFYFGNKIKDFFEIAFFRSRELHFYLQYKHTIYLAIFCLKTN